jgi:hypothetical protein
MWSGRHCWGDSPNNTSMARQNGMKRSEGDEVDIAERD